MHAQPTPMTKRVLSMVALLACNASAAEWEPMPPLPEPNGGFVCGHDKGQILVVGGTNWEGGKKNWLRGVHSFDPVTLRWAKLQDLDFPLAYASALQLGSALEWVGGSDGKKPQRMITSTEGGLLNVSLSHLPEAVVLSAGGVVNDWCIIAGGTDDAANISGVHCAVHALKRSENGIGCETKKVADYPGKAFAVAASAVVDREFFVFGGMNYDAAAQAPVNSAEAYAFTLSKNTWRQLQSLPKACRGLAGVALDEQYIYLAGGYADDFTADAIVYDVKRGIYRKSKALPYAAMVSLVKLDGFIYCLGGEDKKQSRTDKFFRIPVADLK